MCLGALGCVVAWVGCFVFEQWRGSFMICWGCFMIRWGCFEIRWGCFEIRWGCFEIRWGWVTYPTG